MIEAREADELANYRGIKMSINSKNDGSNKREEAVGGKKTKDPFDGVKQETKKRLDETLSPKKK